MESSHRDRGGDYLVLQKALSQLVTPLQNFLKNRDSTDLQQLLEDKNFRKTIQSLENTDYKEFFYLLKILIVFAEKAPQLKDFQTKLEPLLKNFKEFINGMSKMGPKDADKAAGGKFKQAFIDIYNEYVFQQFIKMKNGQHIHIVDLARKKDEETKEDYIPGLHAKIKPLEDFAEKLKQKYGVKFDDFAVAGTLEFDNLPDKVKIKDIHSNTPFNGIGTALMDRACQIAIERNLPLESATRLNAFNPDATVFFAKYFKKRGNLLEKQATEQIMNVGGGTKRVNVSVDKLKGNWDRTPPKVTDDDISKFLARGDIKSSSSAWHIVFRSPLEANEAIELLNLRKSDTEFGYKKTDNGAILEINHPKLLKSIIDEKQISTAHITFSTGFFARQEPKFESHAPQDTDGQEILKFLIAKGRLTTVTGRPGIYVIFHTAEERAHAIKLLKAHPGNDLFKHRAAGDACYLEIYDKRLIYQICRSSAVPDAKSASDTVQNLNAPKLKGS